MAVVIKKKKKSSKKIWNFIVAQTVVLGVLFEGYFVAVDFSIL